MQATIATAASATTRSKSSSARTRAGTATARPAARRTPASTARIGATRAKGATYDEWGYWIAQLYVIDSEAIVGPYNDEFDFHRQTRDAYRIERVTA